MILSGTSIQEQYQRGKININPFQHGQVTTNSYDLTLGASFLRYTCRVLDPRKANPYETLSVGDEGLLMKRGDFILGHSREIIGSDSFVPLIHAKSSIARLGLFVHVTADLVDIGFHGNITFQLYATLPVKIYPGMSIAQVTFWRPSGEIELYRGKYQGAQGPCASQIYRDLRPSGLP
jgi:dCTP deaminase